ncbi:MAG: hypothetical protein ACK5A1_09155, partial [Planctomyces sp.]
MVSCCNVTPPMPKPTLATTKWGLLTGTWYLHNRCPCSDGGCKLELFPIPIWGGWIGGLRRLSVNEQEPAGTVVYFLVSVLCNGSGQYVVRVWNSSDCGTTTQVVAGASCNTLSVSGLVLIPAGCHCCGCFEGEAASNLLDILDSEPSLPPWEPPPEPECDKWCRDPCDPNCCPFGTPPVDPGGNPDCCEACGSGACSTVKPGGHACGSGGCSKSESMFPIQYSSGAMVLRVTDLETSGLG